MAIHVEHRQRRRRDLLGRRRHGVRAREGGRDRHRAAPRAAADDAEARLRARANGRGEKLFYVTGGILEVQPHLVTVLADSALHAEQLDEAEALAARERAREMLEGKHGAHRSRARAGRARRGRGALPRRAAAQGPPRLTLRSRRPARPRANRVGLSGNTASAPCAAPGAHAVSEASRADRRE